MQPYKENKIIIIILNWNGKENILECLHSLEKINYKNFEIIVVDNYSTDGSIEEIKQFINNNSKLSISLICNDENLGFAKANNIAIKQTIQNSADYILLLNNDTVVSENFLQKLNQFVIEHPDYEVITPQIRYYKPDNIIWNCGGKINKWGIKKYYYANKPSDSLPDKNFIEITFVTGCAMMIKKEIILKYGLLSEDFFFGEEDIEFSLRLKKHNVKMACVLTSIIYHKVSSSVDKISDSTIGKVFIHYLNRFINMKKYLSPVKWHLWRLVYLSYIIFLLKFRHKIKIKSLLNFSITLLKESKHLNNIDKQTFDKYFSFKF